MMALPLLQPRQPYLLGRPPDKMMRPGSCSTSRCRFTWPVKYIVLEYTSCRRVAVSSMRSLQQKAPPNEPNLTRSTSQHSLLTASAFTYQQKMKLSRGQ